MHFTVNSKTPYCADKLPSILVEFPNYIEECSNFLVTLEKITTEVITTGENPIECQWCIWAIIYFYGNNPLHS